MRRNHSTAALLFSMCVVSSTAAQAQTWLVVHRNDMQGTHEIDTDSIGPLDRGIRYRARTTNMAGTAFEVNAFATCDPVARQVLYSTTNLDLRFPSPVAAGTLAGDEARAACKWFKQRMPLSSDSAVPRPSAVASEDQRQPREASPQPSPKVSLRALPKEAEPAASSRTTGTGFLVSPGAVVTNEHVVGDCREIRIRQDRRIVAGSLVAASKSHDLALLELDDQMGSPASLRASALLGEDVMVSGYPLSGLLGGDLIVTSGQVNALAGVGSDPMRIQISAPVQVGNSGGPVIDRSGNIVGVVVSKLDAERAAKLTGDTPQNINFAIKAEVLRLFLDANRVTYRSAQYGPKVDSVDIAGRARRFTVQITCTR